MKRTDERTSSVTPGRSAGEGAPALRLVAGRADTVPARGVVADRSGGPARASDPDRVARTRAAREEHRAWEAGAENRAAASMTPGDARWVMAVQASEAIEGGRAAVLRPEVRARLVGSATKMGLRPFDANLILAIVQDAARQGQTLADPDTVDRLGLVRGRVASGAHRSGLVALLCVAFSALWAVLILWWLLG